MPEKNADPLREGVCCEAQMKCFGRCQRAFPDAGVPWSRVHAAPAEADENSPG
jgi:hypothetical protein